MPNEVLQKVGTQLVFADHAGDFGPVAANDLRQGTPTTVQAAVASLADGAAWQSAKFDFGATRAAQFSLTAAIEFAATPTAGDTVQIYLAPSSDSVAANSNPGGVSGSSSAYAGYSSNLAASVAQLQQIGIFICTAQITGTVQIAFVSIFSAPERYGTLIIKNESNAAFHSDDVETHFVITPIIDEVQ